jgi:hypothetical protein
MLPSVVAHADWGLHPKKRWLARATRQADGRYRARAAEPVGLLDTFMARLEEAAGSGGPVLLGFDFPIGLPIAYAERAGITDFETALRGFEGRFYDVAARPNEICLDRPFYPMRPGGCCRQQLLAGLGLAWSDLLRRCDWRSATRPAACALFWTLGGQQVGKAAITGWRDLLAPALRDGRDLALWPFRGSLDALLARHRCVVAETYPAEAYRHLGLNLKGGKGKQTVRRSNAPPLLAWASAAGVDLDPALRAQIEDGFGDDPRGDDRFDAVVGLAGMLNVVLGRRPAGDPDDDVVRRIEGWILGQKA